MEINKNKMNLQKIIKKQNEGYKIFACGLNCFTGEPLHIAETPSHRHSQFKYYCRSHIIVCEYQRENEYGIKFCVAKE